MKYLGTFTVCLALLTGCQATDVRSYWNNRSIDCTDMDAAQEQFADFAELAASAPEEDALAALDVLFDKLSEDPVSYYVHSEWMDGAFYSILSPARNAALYGKAVERMMADGILDLEANNPFLQKLEWIQYNQEGSEALVPGCSRFGTRTLVLVLDLGCPSCREALEKLAGSPAWSGTRKLAVCLGYGPQPAVPGWEYLFPENGSPVFDLNMTPVYFVVTADGKVESGYAPAV